MIIDRIVWNIVSSFVLRQIEKFNHSIDWPKLKADVEERVRKGVPGTWFDDEAVAAVDAILDTLQGALANAAAFQHILDLLQAGKYEDALKALRTLILGAWSATPAGATVTPKAQAILAAAA